LTARPWSGRSGDIASGGLSGNPAGRLCIAALNIEVTCAGGPTTIPALTDFSGSWRPSSAAARQEVRSMPIAKPRPSWCAAVDRRNFLGLGVGLTSALWTPGAEAAPTAGLVEAVRGEAFAEIKGARRPLAVRANVFVEETVMTGEAARLALRFGGGTTLRLGAVARLTIDRYIANSGGEFNLMEGGLLYDRPKKKQNAESVLRSLFGLIAIRGTRVFAGPSNGVFGVFVARGAVDVTAAGKTVTLGRGFGTNIAKPGDEPTDPAAWKAPRIKAALASVS
jgi:FecR protein